MLLVCHANGTNNTPSSANAANIAHASLTLQTKLPDHWSHVGLCVWRYDRIVRSRTILVQSTCSGGGHVSRQSRTGRASAWMPVRPYRTVSISAMPIAPPRLRMRLKRPLASGTCVSDSAPMPNGSAATGTMIAAPRITCGQNISPKSVSRVSNVLSPNPSANRAKPTPVRNLRQRDAPAQLQLARSQVERRR